MAALKCEQEFWLCLCVVWGVRRQGEEGELEALSGWAQAAVLVRGEPELCWCGGHRDGSGQPVQEWTVLGREAGKPTWV